MQPETYDVRLVVHFQDGGYKVRWIEPDGQETKTFPLELPPAPRDSRTKRAP